MIHTSDGESFEDSVDHFFGHNMMADKPMTKGMGNYERPIQGNDLQMHEYSANTLEPDLPAQTSPGERATLEKLSIEDKRDEQEGRDNKFDMNQRLQRIEEEDTLGLGPTAVDKTLQEWGSKVINPKAYDNVIPGHQIAMEPFDPFTGEKGSRMRPDIGGAAGPLGPRGPLESIKSSAIKHSDTGKIYTGINHTEAESDFNVKTGLDPFKSDIQSGFITSKGRFVDRYEAKGIAEKADQIGDNLAWGRIQTNAKRDFLISEDMKHVQEWMNKKYAPAWEKIKKNMEK